MTTPATDRLRAIASIRGEFCVETRPAPCALVVFGASGDLTRRKLLPAAYRLFRRGLLPRGCYLLGAARTPMDDDAYRLSARDDLMRAVPGGEQDRIDAFLALCHYTAGDYGDGAFYARLRERLAELDARFGLGPRRVFYLAVPPTLYVTVARALAGAGLTATAEQPDAWSRVVVEKPFGRDLAGARALDRALHEVLREEQIYRIDHYLGKETVQNILMLRFANAVFEPIWNRRYIDHVQITVAETAGIGGRAGYYEQAGALRDMFQNHMLQMLALAAMEPPASFDADRVRDEKVKLLRSLRPFSADDLGRRLVRGQYGAGHVGTQAVAAYRQEPGVAPDSAVETFVAGCFWVDNWRWEGVPFYVRSGKRLARRVSEIAVVFRPIPHSMFHPIRAEDFRPNVLVLNVQPSEGVSLHIQVKQPGPKLCIGSLAMAFRYADVQTEPPGDAYERLLLDVMLGDPTLFVRSDDVEVSWALMTPILEAWHAGDGDCPLHFYAPGSWGPEAAEDLLRRDGRRWRRPLDEDE